MAGEGGGVIVRVKDMLVTILLAVAILAILTVAAFFLQAYRAVGDLRVTLQHTTAAVDSANKQIELTGNHANATLNTISTSAGDLSKSASAQIDYLQKNSRALRLTSDAMTQFIHETSNSLNGCGNCPAGLIPTATGQLQSTKPGIESFNRSMGLLADTLDDSAPAIKSAAQSTKASGENVQQITQDWKEVSDDTNKWLHGQLNPTKPTMAHRVLLMILNTILGNGIQGAVRR